MIPIPLYKITRIDENNQHIYMIDGMPHRLPGATTITKIIAKEHLPQWASKMCAEYTRKILTKFTLIPIIQTPKISPRFLETLYRRSKKQHRIMFRRAGDVGTRIHQAFEDLISGKIPAMDTDIANCIATFTEFDVIKKMRITASEMKLINLDIGYGCTVDAFAESSDGKMVILEWKSSNQISDEYALQIAAQGYAAKFTFGLDYVPQGYCVRFDKLKPKIEFVKVRSMEDSFEGFKFAFGLRNSMNKIQFVDKKIFKPIKIEKQTKKHKEKSNATT